MRPGLGEILPRMRGRIGADEIVLPIRRRAFGIVLLQRLGVILPLVAEHGAEAVQLPAVAHQNVPVIMPDLVAEMAEQRAIGLVHRGAAVLALGVVGFLQRQVIRPLLWPVMTFCAPGVAGLARKSNAKRSRMPAS